MFSENLKAMRKAKGYTQEELAIKLNVTRQTISRVIRSRCGFSF